jgi:3-deoxy-D-manno-octulosonate 8-phosphate phosphatase (KDO 8-P phosphatase)
MQRVGFAIAVNNAHAFVKQNCDWVTTLSGGRGAVREVTDFILQAQSLLDDRQQQYLK